MKKPAVNVSIKVCIQYYFSS